MANKLEGGYYVNGKEILRDNNKLLISIITVTFNAEKHLRQTIESVLNQAYPNIEYIVIDGGSTDDTLNIFREYDSHIAYWVSEPDKGIYDAMNKGILLAKGDLVGMKNADDWYLPHALEQVADTFKKSKATVVYGNSLHVVQEHPLLANLFVVDHEWIGKGPGLDHRSMFVKTDWHKENLFNTRYKLAADYEVMLRLKDNHQPMAHTQTSLSYKRAGGASYAWKLIWELAIIDWASGRNWLAFQRLTKDTAQYVGLKYGNQLLRLLLGENGFVKWKTRGKSN